MRMHYKFAEPCVREGNVFYFLNRPIEDYKKSVIVKVIVKVHHRLYDEEHIISSIRFNQLAKYQNMRALVTGRCPEVDLRVL